jgi:23S rRNA maturation-related 3'-5' exoribonuclease YhaM
MRNAIAAFLLAVFVLPVSVKMGLVGNYWLQQERYAKELCQERDIELSTCAGKCQLQIQLKKSEGNPVQPQLPEAAKVSVSDFITAETELEQNSLKEHALPIQNNLDIPLCDGYFGRLLAPPRA